MIEVIKTIALLCSLGGAGKFDHHIKQIEEAQVVCQIDMLQCFKNAYNSKWGIPKHKALEKCVFKRGTYYRKGKL